MIKREAMKSTKEAYVLMDSSKFDQVAAITFASAESAVVITDRKDKGKYKGIKIIVVK